MEVGTGAGPAVEEPAVQEGPAVEAFLHAG
jgi:hypothetical protein